MKPFGPFKCLKCFHVWHSPVECPARCPNPRCKRADWDVPRKCDHPEVEWKTKLLDGNLKPGSRVMGWLACSVCGAELHDTGKYMHKMIDPKDALRFEVERAKESQ